MKTQRKQFFKFIVYIWLLLIILIFLGKVIHGNAAVTLIDFTVTYQDNQIKLNWETATERDNALFFIIRSEGNSNNYQRITVYDPINNQEIDSIFPKGDSVSGGHYEVYDKNITNGATYYYKLATVDFNNNLEYYFPTSIINSPARITNTSTSTNTSTIPRKTKTTVVNPKIVTPIPTTSTLRIYSSTPTIIATPPIPTPTFLVATSTPTDASIVIPALPLPSITLIFSDPATATLEVTTTPAQGGIPQNANWFTPQRLVVLGLIVSIWIILGGGFFFVLRKIE